MSAAVGVASSMCGDAYVARMHGFCWASISLKASVQATPYVEVGCVGDDKCAGRSHC